MPLRSSGGFVCSARQGRVFYQIKVAHVSAKSDLPRPTPEFSSPAELDPIAEVTVRKEFTFLDLS